MTNEISILLITAVSIAFFHTLFGPDHYIPFIVMAKSGKWSKTKTAWITFLCGLGHVLSSVVLGLIGVAAGIAVSKLENIESFRGDIAAWLLIAFGLVYFAWGLKKAFKNKPHTHVHVHSDGTFHAHEHAHNLEHSHVHENSTKKTMTPWILFTIFVFGPCEPLIPLVMYPAAQHSTIGVILVTAVFGIITIGTMLTIVMVSLWGINLLPMDKLERFTHALAGATICISGLAIVFLGL
jgi:nickel/cobalt transporter (NicO) family protein